MQLGLVLQAWQLVPFLTELSHQLVVLENHLYFTICISQHLSYCHLYDSFIFGIHSKQVQSWSQKTLLQMANSNCK